VGEVGGMLDGLRCEVEVCMSMYGYKGVLEFLLRFMDL